MNDLEKLSEAVNLLRSNILCPICLEPMQNAVSTRCNHHFCSDCYNKLITINRTAYCPMCHCKVNRRTVLKDAVLDKTVQAVRNLLKSIEQDSGIDFAEALPLPRSTREAVCGGTGQSKQISSLSHPEEVPISKPSEPKQAICTLHAEEIFPSHQDVQQENIDTPKISEVELHLCSEKVPETSPNQSKCELITAEDSNNIPSNTIERETKDKIAKDNADGWLKRYKKQYSGRAPPIQLDESLLFPAELIHPPPKVKKRPRADLDVSKVTTNAKVQSWLELNEENLEECENMSILNGALPRRITVEADVHNSPSDEDELLSVSQLPPKDTIIHIPRAVNYAILPGVDEIETLEPTPSDKIPETREREASELVKLKEVREVIGKSIETDNVDPYEFISSQKSQNNIKQKRKTHTRRKYSKKSKEPLWKDISMYIKETYSNKRSKQDAKVTEASFLAPVSINDTFDNLLAEYRKNLTDEVCADSLSNTKNVPLNDPSTGIDMKNELVHKDEDELNNAKKSLTDPAVEWDATPETLDLSSGSDEEWMETRNKNRKTQRKSKPFKVFNPPSRLSSRRQSKQLSTSKQKKKNCDVKANRRQSRSSFALKQKVEEENDVLESIKGLFKEIDDHNLLTSSQVEREALAVANASAEIQATPDINSKDSHQEKYVNTEKPNICIKEQDHSSNNLGRKSSPGWSHLTQLKKDFKGPKKPTLKALDVSMGCSSSKKNVSFSVPNNENQIAEVETPVVIDDGSIVGIGSVNEINNTSEKVILIRNQEEQNKNENVHLPGNTHEELINDKICESLIDKNGHIPVEETKIVISNQKEIPPEPQTVTTSTSFQTEKKHHRKASFNQDLILSDSLTLGDPIITEDVQKRNSNDIMQTAIDNSTADATEVPPMLDKQECSTAEFIQHGLENPCETGLLVDVNYVQRDRAASDLSSSSCELVGYSDEPNAVRKIGVMKDIINTLQHEIINEEEAIRKKSQVNHILPCNLPSQLIVPESESASSEERTCERENESKFTNNSELHSQQTGDFEIVPDSLDIGMNADEICKTHALILRDDCRTIRMQPEESVDTSTEQPRVCFYKLGTVRPLNRIFITQFIYRGSLAPKRKRKVSRTNTTGILSQKDDESQEIPFITWEQNKEEEPILKKRCLYSAHEVHLKRRSLVAAEGNQQIHSQKEVAVQNSQQYSEQSAVVQTCQKVSSPQTFSIQTSQKVHSLENVVETNQKCISLEDSAVQTSQNFFSVNVETQTSQHTHSHCVANVQTSPSIGKVSTVDCDVQVSVSHRNVQAQTSPLLFKIPAEPSVQPQKQAVEVQTTQSLHRVLDGRKKEFALEEGQISPSILDQPFEDIPLAEECVKPFSHTDGAKEYQLQSSSNTDSEFQVAEVAVDKNLDLDNSHKMNESVEIIYDREKHKVNRQLNFKEACMSPAKSITGNSDAQNSKSKNFKRIRHMSSSESSDEVETGKLMVTKKGKTKDERSLGVKPLNNQIIGLKSDSEPDVVSSENFIPGTYESPQKVQTEEEEEVECLNSEELLQKIMDNIDEDIGNLEKKTSQNEKRKSIPKSVYSSDIDRKGKIGPSVDKRIVSPAQNLEPTTADMFSLTRKESERLISQVQSTGVEKNKTGDIFSDTERESEKVISQPQNFEVRTADMFCDTGKESAGIILQVQSIEPRIPDVFCRSKKESENSSLRKMKSTTDAQKPVPNESVILEESMSDSSDVVEATPKKTEASSVRARSSNSGGRESLQHAVSSVTSPKTKPTNNRAVHSEVVVLPQDVKHPDKSPQKKSSNKITVLTSSENSPKPADRIVSPRRPIRCSPRKSFTVSTPGKNILASSKSVQQPIFVCSGLTPPLIAKVKAAAKMLGAKFCDIFVSEMSHLIVKVDENNAAEKTLKYLQAVASGKWVVSYAWIVACTEAKRLLPEDEYEAVDSMGFDGPRRSRTRTAPLFNNFQFCCVPPFSIITVDKLQEILMLCGGTVVTSPTDFRRKANTFLICIVETESTASEETYGRWLDQYGVVAVGSDWVLDCIGSYCIFSLWPYLMFSVTRERLQALGYSEEMLLSEDENEDDVSAAV